MNKFETGLTTAKERASFDKMKSLMGIVFGARASHFDAFLRKAPSGAKITALSEQVGKPDIHNVISNLDGTLVAPHAQITDKIIHKLQSYQENGQSVAIYTNSSHFDRLNVLRKNGITVAEICIEKPSLEGFKRLCDQENMDPKHTAVVGNFPITDMPLVKEGEPPFFSLNVLVESIPPHRQLVSSWKEYYRARIFHAINLATTAIVCSRNPHMLQGIDI